MASDLFRNIRARFAGVDYSVNVDAETASLAMDFERRYNAELRFKAEQLSAQQQLARMGIAQGLYDAAANAYAAPVVTDAPAAVAVAELPAIEKHSIDCAPHPDAEYVALATSLGIELPVFFQAELEKYFAANFIDVYPMEAVNKYMQAMLTRESMKDASQRYYWFWRPLRAVDVATCKLSRGRIAANSPVPIGGDVRGYEPDPYARPVPFPVLQTVKAISDTFGERVAFFVSDYAAVKPDPFLMVSAPGCPGYVIERWDEPGFRV